MSKLLKASDPLLNGLFSWRIHSIQKTQKNGKLFNVVDGNGKNLS